LQIEGLGSVLTQQADPGEGRERKKKAGDRNRPPEFPGEPLTRPENSPPRGFHRLACGPWRHPTLARRRRHGVRRVGGEFESRRRRWDDALPHRGAARKLRAKDLGPVNKS